MPLAPRPLSSRALARLVLGAVGAVLLGVVAAEAQDTRSPGPQVFQALVGQWRGEGTLFGRPARFSLRWTAEEGGFYRMAFENALVDSTGRATPVLGAIAIYRPLGDSAIGVWLDTRPQRIQLRAAVTDSTLVTDWTAATEEGRTVYRLMDGGSLEVIDSAFSATRRREFGRARYTREP